MLGQKTSYKALGCCALIVAGFFLGIDQENALGKYHRLYQTDSLKYSSISGTLSMFGAFCGVASSVFVALNAIYTTRCLPCVDNNVWRLCLYNNFNACILFLPLMLIFGELTPVFTFPKLFNIPFWFAMTMAGVLGFSMGYVTGYQIQMTSPLTHNVSGTAKSYVQTLLAVVAYSEVCPLRFLSIDILGCFLGENLTLVDIEYIRSWWLRLICTCSRNRNETHS